MRYHLAYKLIA